jgi:putative protease
MKNSEGKILIELLSPAKDLSTGKTAVTAGADAVYIGGPGYSARSAAGNSWEDIKELCGFAHQFYAKVYVAVNTIFYDGEETDVQKSLDQAYNAGADAVIIQDPGILELDLPPIPVIASTQFHNYDPDHVRFLQDAGISRVILARELSLDQIKSVRKAAPDIELEAFVHGALCVSFSGRCYFSQYLSGRSANRGRCMQVCRLTFDLSDGNDRTIVKDQYLLSPKDMNFSDELENMLEAGITSFKIEGRLKDPSYVGNVTAYYSDKLNSIISESGGKYRRASTGSVKLNYKPDLSKSFNRGFTKYFISGRKETVISPDLQKSVGEYIGTVKKIGRDYFTVDALHDLKNGDGICWINSEGKLEGININTVNREQIFPNRKMPQSTGIKIYRNENPSYEKAVVAGADRLISVRAEDEDGISAELEFTHDGSVSQNPELNRKNFIKQFSKSGNTIFEVKHIDIKTKVDYFVPVSVMNQWRREILDALLKKRLENYPRTKKVRNNKIPQYPQRHIDRSYNVSNSLAEKFYRKAGAGTVERAYEISDRDSIKTLMTTRHCIKHHLNACAKFSGTEKLTEPLYLVLKGRKFRLEFDCVNCVMKVMAPENEDL